MLPLEKENKRTQISMFIHFLPLRSVFCLQAKGATRKLGELAHFGQGIGFALQNATKMDCDGLTLWSDWGRRQGPGKSP